MSGSRGGWALLLAALLGAAWLYAPGFAGYWMGDDFTNLHTAHVWQQESAIFQGLAGQWTGSVSAGAAFLRPLIMTSLLGNYLLAGADYGGWYLYGFALHLACVALLAALGLRLAASAGVDGRWSAALGAALFGLCPFTAEAVYWVSARSDVSVTFFVLLGLLLWVDPQRTGRPWAWGLPLCLLPALLFKESAALAPLQAALLWLALPSLRDRPRSLALLVAGVLALAFLLWRALLFGDLWQVYGGDETAVSALAKLQQALLSLPAWLDGWSGGRLAWGVAYLGALALALVLAVPAAPARWPALAFLLAAGGALLATLANLGALRGNGEGGRLLHSASAWLALAVVLACARLPAVLGARTGMVVRAVALAAVIVGAGLLHAHLQQAWTARATLARITAALPQLVAADPGPVLLLVPDHIGPVVAFRNAQAAMVLRPVQAQGLIDRILPALPDELPLRHAQFSAGWMNVLRAARMQHWPPAPLPDPPADQPPLWPRRIACWSQRDAAIVQFAAPIPDDAAQWSAMILADARAAGCLPA